MKKNVLIVSISILEMPFAQRRISLFLLLPDDPVDGIKQVSMPQNFLRQ
jgi:hypothetical protein